MTESQEKEPTANAGGGNGKNEKQFKKEKNRVSYKIPCHVIWAWGSVMPIIAPNRNKEKQIHERLTRWGNGSSNKKENFRQSLKVAELIIIPWFNHLVTEAIA